MACEASPGQRRRDRPAQVPVRSPRDRLPNARSRIEPGRRSCPASRAITCRRTGLPCQLRAYTGRTLAAPDGHSRYVDLRPTP
jgi:hypothetical protein